MSSIVKALEWSVPAAPTKDVCSYDHCFAESPLGQYRLEWKSWKGNTATVFPYEAEQTDGSDGVVVYGPGEDWIICEYSLDDAKAAAQKHFEQTVIACLVPFVEEERERLGGRAEAGSPVDGLPAQR